MKQVTLILVGLLLTGSAIFAQNKTYDVVFDLTSADTNAHKTVVRWISGIIGSNPNARLEVVLYSASSDMVLKKQSVVAKEIGELSKNPNVRFRVCEITLKRKGISKDELIPGVQTVPDGIYEIIERQRDGWGYIKVGG